MPVNSINYPGLTTSKPIQFRRAYGLMSDWIRFNK
jgi:hypothetical protein